ncbi:MAG: hypothetical protein ACHP8A_05520 [Terriglobales bacterium]
MAALRNRWWVINKCTQIVTLDFLLQFAKQFGFLHGGLLNCAEEGDEQSSKTISRWEPESLSFASKTAR